jgi:putative intracellular protease/amidase
MQEDDAIKKPLSWTDAGFSVNSFDLIFLPGGHEKSVRQLIDSPIIQKQLADYFAETKKPSRKAVAAVCHGVMALSEASGADGKSALHDATTTALPGAFEGVAYWGTRLFLGDYYKTYGAGSPSVQSSVGPPVPFDHLFSDII